MADYLLKLARNPMARRLVRGLRIPVPMPPTLERDDGPWNPLLLHDRTVVVGGTEGAELGPAVASALLGGAASVTHVGDETLRRPYLEEARKHDRSVALAADEELRPHALVFDATGLQRPRDLGALHRFFHPWVLRLRSSGRIVVVAREDHDHPETAATIAGLQGFVRSVAKEAGRRGGTAQLLLVERGSERRLMGPLQFFLSPKSAFVSGQVIRVSSQAVGEAHPVQDQPLAGKTAVVTGAARGIGAQIAKTLAREGGHVIAVDRPQAQAAIEQLARAIGGSALPVDITTEDAGNRLVDYVGEHRDRLDVLIHNAGITRDKTLARMSRDQWDQTIEVNLEAITRVTPALLETVAAPEARIVCLSSIAGIAGNYGQTNYATSKAGVIGYVRALAPRIASRGMTINAVAPGFIETDMTGAMPAATREVARRLNAVSQGGRTADVAELATLLATPASSGITGQVVRVCGLSLVGA